MKTLLACVTVMLITLINYVEMFSLLGVLSMEGRVWFEDKPYEDKSLRYALHLSLLLFSFFFFFRDTDIN